MPKRIREEEKLPIMKYFKPDEIESREAKR